MLVLGLALFPAFVGCNGLGFGVSGLSARPTKKIASQPESPAAGAGAIVPDDRAVIALVQEKDAQGRERCVWIRNVDPQSPFRWHYPKLDAVLAQPAEQRPNLKNLLDDRDPKVAFNAAIALGRSGDGQSLALLGRAVRTPTLPLPMRCAAAEALGSLHEPTAAKRAETVAELRKLIDRYGRYSPKSTASYVSELHEELLRGLARREDASSDERFVAALKSPRAEVRLEALRAWSASKSGKLPIEATDRRTEVDPRVRAAALAAIVAQNHPQALDYLQEGLADTDFTVRRAAIAGLGRLGGNEALAILKEQYKDRSDGIRGEAVKAFAAMKAEKPVLEAADDKSWRVRLKAADALAAFPGVPAAAAVEKLLDDPSAEVQTAAIRALQTWPLERSGPILLAAMGKPAFTARKAAAQELAERWPPAANFPVDAPADRRAKILQDLDMQFRSRFGIVQTNQMQAVDSKRQKPQSISPQTIAEIESLLAAGDTRALIAYGPALIDVLDVLRFEREQTLSESVYRDVLPKLRTEFAVIDRLNSQDATERRGAARELQSCAAKRSCGRLALDRLSQLMAAENDDLVWLGVLQAISNENGPEAAAIASAGLGHPSSEVRRKVCIYLAAHPDRQHIPRLLPALEDVQPLVVCAAVEALAASGTNDPAPFIKLLNSTNDDVQFAAATALVQMNDPAGKPALERLAYSNDPQIRALVARAMGEYPDPSFIPILIHLLSDKNAVSRVALSSLPRVVGEDIAKSSSQHPASPTEQISSWKRWYERQ